MPERLRAEPLLESLDLTGEAVPVVAEALAKRLSML